MLKLNKNNKLFLFFIILIIRYINYRLSKIYQFFIIYCLNYTLNYQKISFKTNRYIMKKTILFITLFACATMVNAQDYLDILKVSHSQATLGNVD